MKTRGEHIWLDLQELHDIRILYDFLVLRFGVQRVYLRGDGRFVLACENALVVHGVSLPLQLPDAPTGFGAPGGVKLTGLVILYPHEETVMGPAQFGTQCVPNWKHHIKLTHGTQISGSKSLPKLRSQLLRKEIQKLLAISRTVIFPTSAVKLFSDLPIRCHHCGIDRRVQPALGGDNGVPFPLIP